MLAKPSSLLLKLFLLTRFCFGLPDLFDPLCASRLFRNKSTLLAMLPRLFRLLLLLLLALASLFMLLALATLLIFALLMLDTLALFMMLDTLALLLMLLESFALTFEFVKPVGASRFG